MTRLPESPGSIGNILRIKLTRIRGHSALDRTTELGKKFGVQMPTFGKRPNRVRQALRVQGAQVPLCVLGERRKQFCVVLSRLSERVDE